MDDTPKWMIALFLLIGLALSILSGGAGGVGPDFMPR
jgi:hypothetical protein